MTRIVLTTASAELVERMHHATGGAFLALPEGPLPADPAHLFAQLDNAPAPDVVVIDSGSATEQALDLAARFDQQCPSIAVILVSDLGPEIGLSAMRAGVRDILHPAAEISDIRMVLDRASEVAQARGLAPALAGGAPGSAPVRTGRVISVVSPKGGVGKTTVSTNLAVGLALAAPHSTVLVDLDVQFGDVASALNLQPEHSLTDMVNGPASRDTMMLKTFLTLHETGLYVICGPPSPAGADTISGAQVSQLLEMLAWEFRYVVVDTAPGLSEHTLAAMDQTSDLVLLTSMDVPGVRGLRKELDTLTELDMFTDSRHVVLNFTDTRGGLSLADVEATIGTGVDLMLPRSKAVPGSVNQGIPLLQSGVRDPMTKQLRRLVDRFAPGPAATRRPRRGEGRHRGRRRVLR
ncbi:MAG: AAA family ATPase [Actinomycetales bacterium]|nr:AAA family ATPase [Actinomycetales bacterium]